MNFILNPGELLISNIKDENDRGRLARIEIEVLKKITTMKCDAIVDGATRRTFDPARTEDVRNVLIGFCINPET